MQRSQPARKYPLKSRLIAWVILVLFMALVGWLMFRTVQRGVTLATIAGIVVAAVMGWRNYRDAAGAKHR